MTVRRIKSYSVFYAVAFLIISSDQLTKFWVLSVIPPNTYEPPAAELISGFLYLVHIGNKGAAWGILSGHGELLALLGLGAIACIYFYRHELELKRKACQVAFGLMCGGIIGNIIDRLLHGAVIDFVDVHLPGYRWPAFNVADSAISVGVIFYLGLCFFATDPPVQQDPPPEK